MKKIEQYRTTIRIVSVTIFNLIATAIYFFVWVLMPISYILNIEQRIQSKNSLYVPIVKSGSFSDIYCYNYDKLRSPRHFVNQEKLHLYKYAIDEFINIKIKRGYASKTYDKAKAKLNIENFFRLNTKTQEKLDFIKNNTNI